MGQHCSGFERRQIFIAATRIEKKNKWSLHNVEGCVHRMGEKEESQFKLSVNMAWTCLCIDELTIPYTILNCKIFSCIVTCK